jgi:hypothetical protein
MGHLRPAVVQTLSMIEPGQSVAERFFENSYFIAGPAEQESGADWRVVESLLLMSRAFGVH